MEFPSNVEQTRHSAFIQLTRFYRNWEAFSRLPGDKPMNNQSSYVRIQTDRFPGEEIVLAARYREGDLTVRSNH